MIGQKGITKDTACLNKLGVSLLLAYPLLYYPGPDHCRAMGYKIRGVTVILEELDVARAKPKPQPARR